MQWKTTTEASLAARHTELRVRRYRSSAVVLTTVRSAKELCICATPVDAREILGILDHQFQQEIGVPGHQVTFQHIGNARDRPLERVQHLVRLAAELDFNVDSRRFADLSRIQQRHVARNEPVNLEALHTAVAGRGGQRDALGQIGIRNTPLALQHPQNAPVGFV